MSDFRRLRKTWKVLSTVGGQETVGHKIKIGGTEDPGQATVYCLYNPEHKYGNGSYYDNPPRIESGSYIITLIKEGSPNEISCIYRGGAGGSWTADDNLPQEED